MEVSMEVRTTGRLQGKTTVGKTDQTDESLIQPVDEVTNDTEDMKYNSRVIIGVYIVVIILGVITGYVLSSSGVVRTMSSSSGVGTKESATAVGSTDTKTFKDQAQGVIEKGGLDGEGTHKLIREGGPSQTAYLISSIVDLDEFVGKKVTVWGQTMAAKKVSWLMDVGKIELISQ